MRALKQVVRMRAVVERARRGVRTDEGVLAKAPVVDLGSRLHRRREWRTGRVGNGWR